MKDSPPQDDGEDPVPSILRGPDARTVLERLVRDDSLEIHARCQSRLRDQALLLSAERLFLRTSAWVAHDAHAYAGRPQLDIWLAGRISKATRDLLDSEREWARAGIDTSEQGETFIAPLASALGMEPGLLRRGCVEFNSLPYPTRRAFWAIVIEGTGIKQVLVQESCSHAKLMQRLRRAAQAIGIDRRSLPGLTEGGNDDV